MADDLIPTMPKSPQWRRRAGDVALAAVAVVLFLTVVDGRLPLWP